MRRRSLSLIFLLLLLLTTGLVGCEENSALASRNLQLRISADHQPLGFTPGDQVQLEKENREALLVILKGVWPQNADLRMDLVRVIEADVFVAQRDYEGDPHWITRAQVRGADGEVLWSQRINSLSQLLEFLNIVIEDQSTVNLTIRQVAQLVEREYPQLLEFAVKVPTGIVGGETYVIEIANEAGQWREAASLPIADLVAAAQPTELDFEVDTIVATGPDEDRLTIAIIGDGYRASERGAFEADAQAVAERFLATSPMTEHADLFNIKTVWAPSQESGASYDCNFQGAPPGCEQGFRDTAFETTFVIPALMDRFNLPLGDVSDRVAMPIQIGKVFEAGAMAGYDDIVMISNSRKRAGFAGLYISLVTAYDNRASFPDVAVHELGHSLGLLGDEYMVPGDSCYFNEPLIPLPANIGELTNGEVKWSEWIAEGTPLPTPNNEALQYPVGAYEGAYNCDFLVRPSHRCKMNSSRDEFCSVCAEQMVRRFYAFIDPPLNETINISRLSEDQVRIRIPLRADPERYEVIWSVNGAPIHLGSSFTFGPRNFLEVPSNTWVPMEVTVRNSSDFVHTRDEALESTYRFEVRLEE